MSVKLFNINFIVLLLLASELSIAQGPPDVSHNIESVVYSTRGGYPSPNYLECAQFTGDGNKCNSRSYQGMSTYCHAKEEYFNPRSGESKQWEGGCGHTNCKYGHYNDTHETLSCSYHYFVVTSECVAPFSDDGNGNCVRYCPLETPLMDGVTGACYAEPEPQSCSLGNPVLISSGEKIQKEVPDYTESRSLGLRFQRDYASFRAPEANPDWLKSQSNANYSYFAYAESSGWTKHFQQHGYSIIPSQAVLFEEGGIAEHNPKPGAKQWRHNYRYSLLYSPFKGQVTLIRPSGTKIRFKQSGEQYINAGYGEGYITKNGDGNWLYNNERGLTETYHTDGNLLLIENAFGVYNEFTYSSEGLLYKVEHSEGDTITFSYDEENQLQSAVFPNGSSVQFTYSEVGNVTAVQKTKPVANADPVLTTRIYHYEDPVHLYALTGITDERNVRYATWKYDERGRAIESTHGSETVDRFQFDFSDPIKTVTTNPLGKKTIYHYSTETGTKRIASVEGEATANCAAAYKNYTYFDNGFIETKTDWKGNITRYQRDSQGREIVRTEAEGTNAERVTRTEWHSSLPLPVKVTEHKRTVEYSYDEKGKLLSQKIKPIAL